MKNPDRLSFILRRGPAAAEIGEGSAAVLFWGRPFRAPLFFSWSTLDGEALAVLNATSKNSHNDTFCQFNETKVALNVKALEDYANMVSSDRNQAQAWCKILSFRDNVSL